MRDSGRAERPDRARATLAEMEEGWLPSGYDQGGTDDDAFGR